LCDKIYIVFFEKEVVVKNTEPLTKTHQQTIERKKAKRKAKRQLIAADQPQGKNIVLQIFQTIVHFFPDLFDKMREIEDYRKKSDYQLVELIMAGIAMFIFKEGSRNAFNNDRKEGKFKRNYEKVFKMKMPHMDTVDKVMRKLTENELEELKRSMIRTLLEKKALHKFRFLGKWFLIAVDATGVASFDEKHCENCLHRTSKSGKTTYFHNVLDAKLIFSNGFSISLGTGWIENPEEYDKQDCELKAFKRLADKLKKWYPRLPICIVADGLYPNQTFFNICKNKDWDFIVTFKEGNLPTVWEEVFSLKSIVKGNHCTDTRIIAHKKIQQDYCWINKIDYHGHLLNWVECVEIVASIDSDAAIEPHHFVHITNLSLERTNVIKVSQGGRLRWKIENEGFNTQKNLGYNLKHKYSRKNYRATKNYYQCLQIGHLINQLVEQSHHFKELLKGKITLKHLWKCVIGFLTYGDIDNEELVIVAQHRCQIRFE